MRTLGLPRWLCGKESACQCKRFRRHSFHPCVEKIPGEGNGNPLQYSCLENLMDGGAWQAAVHGVAQSRIRLSDTHFYFPASIVCSASVQNLHGNRV